MNQPLSASLISNFRSLGNFAKGSIEKAGVATVPGDNFYAIGREGERYLRFAFCRSLETLEAGIERLRAGLR